MEVQISQNNYHNTIRIWGGEHGLASEIEDFLNQEHEEFQALHFLNHPWYKDKLQLRPNFSGEYKFIALSQEDIEVIFSFSEKINS